MTIAYIGLGSNLEEPIKQVLMAITAINTIDDSKIVQLSSIYGSKPMGPQDQPDYINAVLALNTKLSAIELLNALQKIELDAGRIRKEERWGARLLDLDIILFGQNVINNERLTVPHYGMKEREFVLRPLHEISPDLTLPCGEKVATLSELIADNDLEIKCVPVLADILSQSNT
jgi:2-amino-4-hydroxy-6-hydroxymethyldihydropteridine diphosphokinase